MWIVGAPCTPSPLAPCSVACGPARRGVVTCVRGVRSAVLGWALHMVVASGELSVSAPDRTMRIISNRIISPRVRCSNLQFTLYSLCVSHRRGRRVERVIKTGSVGSDSLRAHPHGPQAHAGPRGRGADTLLYGTDAHTGLHVTEHRTDVLALVQAFPVQ